MKARRLIDHVAISFLRETTAKTRDREFQCARDLQWIGVSRRVTKSAKTASRETADNSKRCASTQSLHTQIAPDRSRASSQSAFTEFRHPFARLQPPSSLSMRSACIFVTPRRPQFRRSEEAEWTRGFLLLRAASVERRYATQNKRDPRIVWRALAEEFDERASAASSHFPRRAASSSLLLPRGCPRKRDDPRPRATASSRSRLDHLLLPRRDQRPPRARRGRTPECPCWLLKDIQGRSERTIGIVSERRHVPSRRAILEMTREASQRRLESTFRLCARLLSRPRSSEFGYPATRR